MRTEKTFEFVIPRECTPHWNGPKQLSCIVSYQYPEEYRLLFLITNVQFKEYSFMYVADPAHLMTEINNCIKWEEEVEEERINN